MKNFIKQCFTGKDNQTGDIHRVLIFIGCIVFFYCTIYNVHTFNYVEFATAFGLILAGGAGALKLKESTEPSA